MRRLRYWGLGIATLIVVLAGLLWWAQGMHSTPLEPNALATMSETEQVAWLIERILERSERPDAIRETLYSWLPRLRMRMSLSSHDLAVLAQACAEYDLQEPLQRLRRWARTTEEKDSWYRAEAQILAKRREWQRALEVARRIREQAERVGAYCVLATEQARAGQREAARRTLLENLGSLSIHAAGGELFVAAAAQLRFPDLAEQATVRGVKPGFQPLTLAMHVAPAYAAIGQDSQAVRVARQIRDPIIRGLAYAEIARVQIERRQFAQAIALVESAKEPAGYACVARYLAEQGRLAQARALWRKAVESANRLPEPMRFQALAQVATEYALAGDPETASRILQQADRASWSPERVRTHHTIASAYAAQGKRAEAVAALNPLMKKSDPVVALQYPVVARELYHHGYHEDARIVLRDLCARLKRHFPDWYSGFEWSHAVSVLASREDTLPLARELIAWYEAETQPITDPKKRFVIDLSLAELHAHVGNIPKAVHYTARCPDREEQTGSLIRVLRLVVDRRKE